MKKDNHKTRVRFYKEADNSVLAVFPDENEGYNQYACYAHVGQHSTAHKDYLKTCVPANVTEFDSLLAELESIGYNLTVVSCI